MELLPLRPPYSLPVLKTQISQGTYRARATIA